MTPLFISDLVVNYGSKPVLKDIHYRSPSEGIIGILGPNGAGKSTLIKCILGLVSPLYGVIRIFDAPIEKQRKYMAYIPQRQSIDWSYPINVLDFVCMGLYRKIGWFRPVKKMHKKQAHEALEMVNMEKERDTQIGELSGGQQQRMFFARALVQKADLYLLDEPFVGLDARTERDLEGVLRNLADEGKTILIVHHNLETVLKLFDHIILLNHTIITQGPTKEVFSYQNILQTYGNIHLPEVLAQRL